MNEYSYNKTKGSNNLTIWYRILMKIPVPICSSVLQGSLKNAHLNYVYVNDIPKKPDFNLAISVEDTTMLPKCKHAYAVLSKQITKISARLQNWKIKIRAVLKSVRQIWPRRTSRVEKK